MTTTVHVVFKTHLDLGFTDTAAAVTERYVHSYLPRAIQLAAELRRRNGPARFVWTTGSWLVHEALRLGSPQERQALEAAIELGDVAWHGLPLTTHTELMDAGLLEHAIGIGRRLDDRFGRHTIAAKLTDVPGHTIGLVPYLERAGLQFLHIGVNAASAVPEVPEFFVWRAPDGSEVVVNYAQDYGTSGLAVAVAPGGTDALHLAHTGDNLGPPPLAEIEELFQGLQANYPGARIVASTLDQFAQAVLAARAELPVVTDEIGDSWIHGAASDPIQTARLRALLRLRSRWVGSGELVPGRPECDDFSDGLLLIPEHTWGKDLKTYLPDYGHYDKAAFQRARTADVVDVAANPAGTRGYSCPRMDRPRPTYGDFEESWAEQRAHVSRALAALPAALLAEAAAAIAGSSPGAEHGRPDAEVPIDPGVEHAVGNYRVTFGGDGALIGLVDGTGTSWAGPDNPLAGYRYHTYDERDEQRWLSEYTRHLDRHGEWAVPDFSKPGLAIAERLPGRTFTPQVVAAARRDLSDGSVVTLRLELAAEACETWGGARDIRLSYRFPASSAPIEITLDLCDRDASRLPEASWLGFRPLTGPGDWRLTKIGTEVDPRAVVRSGNRTMHGVDQVSHRGAGRFLLQPLDSPVVAVGRPALLQFDNRVAEPDDGIYVNLHNNVWGTNFPMWFDDDTRFRFLVTTDATTEAP
ncbi:DUF5054 domain-containing protein [Kribbella sp. NPDC004138]